MEQHDLTSGGDSDDHNNNSTLILIFYTMTAISLLGLICLVTFFFCYISMVILFVLQAIYRMTGEDEVNAQVPR